MLMRANGSVSFMEASFMRTTLSFNDFRLMQMKSLGYD